MLKETWLTDLTRCEPADAISRERRPGTWLALDYELEHCKGVMLVGLPGSGAPAVTLRLGLTGWHQIRLGIFYAAGSGAVEDRVLCARLSDDAGFTRFRLEDFRPAKDGNYPEKVLRWNDIAEAFWRCADLTGQDLIVARPTQGEMATLESNLAYVRLVPMDEGAIAEWKAEQPTTATRTMIGYETGFFERWGASGREDLQAAFEHFRDSDFGIVLHRIASSGITYYPSRVGQFVAPDQPWSKMLHDCVQKGLDPLAEAIKAAHACGLKLFPQNRLCGAGVPPNHVLRAELVGEALAKHPEWACTYWDGKPIHHFSFAFEGVRDFHARLIREWALDYGADGICILFSRSYPFVYYEQPVCEAFAKEYEEDMRRLPPGDIRVQRTRASFLTRFLRQVRAVLDEVGKAQGRSVPTCYTVPVFNSPPDLPQEAKESALAECLFNALDVPTWIKEGLVDHLVVHLHIYGEHDGTAMQPRIREFTNLAKGTVTRVYADIYPRRMPPRQYRKIALSYYAAGADGLAIFDTHYRYWRASEWAFVKRLGHREDLARWQGKGDDYYRVVPVRTLADCPTDREFALPTDG